MALRLQLSHFETRNCELSLQIYSGAIPHENSRFQDDFNHLIRVKGLTINLRSKAMSLNLHDPF